MIIVSISNKPTEQSSATTAINTTNTSLLNRVCIDLLVQSINFWVQQEIIMGKS